MSEICFILLDCHSHILHCGVNALFCQNDFKLIWPLKRYRMTNSCKDCVSLESPTALWYGICHPSRYYRDYITGTLSYSSSSLLWRHNGHDGVSNHQPQHCLLNRLFGCRSKKTSKLRVTALCAGTGEFPAQMANNAEKCFHLMTSSCVVAHMFTSRSWGSRWN